MRIDKNCLGKWMYRKGFFGSQEFKPLYIIESSPGEQIMDEKIVGLDGGKWIGFGFYHTIKMVSPDLDDWNFINRADYCNKKGE